MGSIRILGNAVTLLTEKCFRGLKADREKQSITNLSLLA